MKFSIRRFSPLAVGFYEREDLLTQVKASVYYTCLVYPYIFRFARSILDAIFRR